MARTLRASFVAVPSDNPKASRDFYEGLLRTDFSRSLWEEEGYHTSLDGVDLDIEVRHSPQETTTLFLEVDDLEEMIEDATAAGGQVVWGPSGIRVPERNLKAFKQAVRQGEVDARLDQLARAAVIVDPGGGQIGLIQLAHRAGTPVSEIQKSVLRQAPQIATGHSRP